MDFDLRSDELTQSVALASGETRPWRQHVLGGDEYRLASKAARILKDAVRRTKHQGGGYLAAVIILLAAGGCNRPDGHIEPLSAAEREAVLAPSVEVSRLEARLNHLEQSVTGTALHNRMDAGDINQAVGPSAREEFAVLEQEWEIQRDKIAGRLQSLRKRLGRH